MVNKKLTGIDVFKNGFLSKNPLLVSMLGVCPALATTTTVHNGFSMGCVVIFVLIFSNITISLIKTYIPDKIRLSIYMTIIAGYVCSAEMITRAYAPEIDNALGFYISLVVVNCVVLSRSEEFASKNSVYLSFIDALANGFGYTAVLVIISFIREVFGKGEILGINFAQYIGFNPIGYLYAPSGGFLILGLICALYNKIQSRKGNKND